MKIEQIALPLATLVVGAALGYCLKPAVEVSNDEPIIKTEVKEVEVARDDGKDLASLKRQLNELRRQIAESERAEREAAKSADEQVVAEKQPEGPMGWLERMKKENPERYTSMTNEIARRGERMREHGRNTYAFLDSLDLSAMSEGDRETVTQYKDLLARRDELMQKLQDASDLERMTLGPQMGEMMREMHGSNGKLRDVLFRQTAQSLGYTGEEVNVFTDTMKEIIQLTEGGWGGPGGMGGGRGGRGGRQGGGRR